MTLWAIKSKKGFLKGNGDARFLIWFKLPYSGKLYRTKKSALNVIEKIKKRKYDGIDAELFELELIEHGTVDDILEKELL